MTLSGLVHAARSFLRVEGENVRRYDVPWRRRLWLYRHGFLSSKDALWTVTDDTRTDYLSDAHGLDSRLRGINRPYDRCLDDEVLFPLIAGRTHADLLPEVYGVVRGDGFAAVDGFDAVESFEQLVALLRTERVVAKPTTTAQGEGVRVLDGRDGQLRIDGREVSKDGLVDDLRGGRDLVVEEYVSQATYAADIYPRSVNTVRILTMVDPDTGEPFVPATMHRFGTRASGRVDNASSGGISAGIDVETGELGEALVPADGGGWTWRETHPDTGARIAGTTVPAWREVKAGLLDLAAEYAGLWPLVAWDVVARDDRGTITVIEGNANPGTTYIQAHHPLLADDRARRFFEHHGVV